MLQTTRETTIQKNDLFDIYQRHNQRIQDNNASTLPLCRKINDVANTPCNKTTNTTCDRGNGKTGLLKCLLACIKTREENHQSPLSAVITNDQEPVYSSSPDYYYKNMQETTPMMAPAIAEKITQEQTRADITPNDEYRHENQRNIYYDTVARNIYFPLGSEMYKKLDSFCQSGIKEIVSSAFNSDLNTRYELLHNIIAEINKYKVHQAALRDKNINIETLSPEQHEEEIITKRKLIVLYLAAESIIKQSSGSYFHMIAMANIKNYSMKDLEAKEKNILRYVPKHEAMIEY